MLSKLLDNRKTYLCGAAIVILSGLRYLGYVDQATYEVLTGIFGGGGLVALRAGVKKSGR